MDRTPLRYSRAFPSRPAEFSVAPLTMAPQPQFSQSYRLGIGSEFQSRPVPWGPHLTVRPALLSLPVVFSFQISCLGPVFVCLCLIVCIGESVCRFVHVSTSACQGEKGWIPSPRIGVMQAVVSLLTWEWEPISRPLGEQQVLLTAEPYLPSLGAVLWEATYYRERNSPKTPVYSRTFCAGLLFVSMLFYYILFYWSHILLLTLPLSKYRFHMNFPVVSSSCPPLFCYQGSYFTASLSSAVGLWDFRRNMAHM